MSEESALLSAFRLEIYTMIRCNSLEDDQVIDEVLISNGLPITPFVLGETRIAPLAHFDQSISMSDEAQLRKRGYLFEQLIQHR